MSDDLVKFCKKIKYNFNKIELLEEALTHPSLNKKGKPNYQRLEFLGDKVLSMVIADFLFDRYPKEKEGALSKRHGALVSGSTLAKVALNLKISELLRISPGEESMGGKENLSNLEDALEAVIGAIYFDLGKEQAKSFILESWKDFLTKDLKPPQDAVSELQEIVQDHSKELPKYTTKKIGGDDHKPIFLSVLKIGYLGLEFSAKGSSKKDAQKKVAKKALEKINK